MFDSLTTILNQFLINDDRELTRFDVYNVITHRGSRPTDLYYLCNVRNSWIIVFETGHFQSFNSISSDAEDIFESELFTLLYWIGPKDINGRTYELPLHFNENTLNRMGMTYTVKETGLCYAVIAVEFLGKNPPRYEPETSIDELTP